MYSAINQAFWATIDEGLLPLKEDNHNEFDYTFVDSFASKFNYTDICKNEVECRDNTNYMPSYFKKYNSLQGKEFGSYAFSYYGFRLLSGEVIMFGHDHSGLCISVDLNSYINGPNVLGKDVFVMMIRKYYPVEFLPLGSGFTYNKNLDGDECKCGKEYGAASGSYITTDDGVVSGGCCSAYYLLEK